MRAIIIAGGEARKGQDWRLWSGQGDLLIGADGGAAQALAHGLVPHWVVGDMDSLSGEERVALEAHGCRFLIHPRAKDETDLELALTCAVEQDASEIIILGALGGRLDHMLANVLLLTLPSLEGLRVRIVDGEEEALLVRGGEAITLSGAPGDLVSLLPLGGEARGVSTSGLVWGLEGARLQFGSTRGVSNEMTVPEARVQVEKGFLLVIHRTAAVQGGDIEG